MQKTHSHNDNLPNIYSNNALYFKLLSPTIKNNLINNYYNSLKTRIQKIQNNSLPQEKAIFNETNEKNKNYLKLSINNNEIKLNKNFILTKYDNNSSINQKSKLKNVFEKIKIKNNNIHFLNLHNKNNLNNNDNNNKVLFSNSYYNFLLNLKTKRDFMNKTNNNQEENHQKEKKTINNYIKDIKSTFSYTIHNLKNNKNRESDENNHINLDITSPEKSLENLKITSKTPNKIKLTTYNTINNNFKIYSNYKNNAFNIHYTKYSNSINNNSLLNKIICPLCHKEIDNNKYKSHFNLHPSKIFNWLYLGSFNNARNIIDLKELKINYILNCAIECKNDNIPSDINYYHALIYDSPFFQLNFEKTNNFINKAKISGGNILIHCQLGISRSTSCLIAYMIKYLGYTTLTALQFIKNKRPQVMPNFGFIQQLKNYENRINKSKNNIKIDEDNNINKKKEQNFDLFIKNNIL